MRVAYFGTWERGYPRNDQVIAALGTPSDYLEAKSGLVLADKCWATLRTEIVAEVPRETPSSYYVQNTCPLLMKYKAATGPAGARCRERAP